MWPLVIYGRNHRQSTFFSEFNLRRILAASTQVFFLFKKHYHNGRRRYGRRQWSRQLQARETVRDHLNCPFQPSNSLTIQSYHGLKTNTLHLRPRPSNSQRPEPPRSPTKHTTQHIPASNRPRRYAKPTQPAPHSLPNNLIRTKRRPPQPPRTPNPPPTTQAAPNTQTTDEMGAVRAEEGDWQVQHENGRCVGGQRAAQEACL